MATKGKGLAIKKNVATKLDRGGGVVKTLMAGPLEKELFVASLKID